MRAQGSHLARVEAWFEHVVVVAPALLVAIPAVGGVVRTSERASFATLGRDQGIFQYVAWAVGQGDVLYRDVRDVNGPVITMIHALFQCLGGVDEHRFRVLDLLFTGLSFVFAGALLPSIVGAASGAARSVSLLTRASWALAAWVALSAQYLVYGFWDTAQRESFLDWFVLVSIAIQSTASASGDPRTNSVRALLFASGALSFVPWMGKPTFALFTIAQIAALLLEPGGIRARMERLLFFVAGGLVGIGGPLVYVAWRGDVVAWARLTFVDVPAMYRFIWPRSAWTILSLPGYSKLAIVALATSAGLMLLIALRRLPLRGLPVALMPALGLVSVVVQSKGFPYHFHPVSIGVVYGWLVALAVSWPTEPLRGSAKMRLPLRSVVLIAALLVGARTTLLASAASYPPSPAGGAREAASPERLALFERVDYFPRELRAAAEYVAERTSPDDRVQLYAMDAYLLFLAKRRSATPYIYAYDLNVDAALHGSFDPGGRVPSVEQARRIRSMGAAHVADLHARLERSPPAAFVFVDQSPLMSWADAFADFAVHAEQTAAWLSEHYEKTAVFGGIHVWLRDDLAAREADEPR